MRTSAGLLLYRTGADGPEVLLVHMGGPFWAKKDAAGWSVPKGEYEPGEDPHDAAIREFAEELGAPPPAGAGADLDLGQVRQSSAKTVTVYARQADFDADTISSNVIEIQWPPRSGRTIEIPEVDRAQWCDLDAAAVKLVKGQVPFLSRLAAAIAHPS